MAVLLDFKKAWSMVRSKITRSTYEVCITNLISCVLLIEYRTKDVQMIPGFKNVMFGGEGLFMTTLTGPGTVWLQGQPPQRMISEIARRVPSGGGIGLAVPIPGMGGGEGGGGESGGDASSGTT